jgi:hypothetical protein
MAGHLILFDHNHANPVSEILGVVWRKSMEWSSDEVVP